MKKFLLIILTVILSVLLFISCTPITVAKVIKSVQNINTISEVDTNTLRVSYLNVGQGDSIVIQQGNHAMLIDAGNIENGSQVNEFLSNSGISKLDYIVATHPHADHIGGLASVMKNIKFATMFMPVAYNNISQLADVVIELKKQNRKMDRPLIGTEFKLGDATFVILAPNSDTYEDMNNHSIVIKLTFKSTSFLFMGDASYESENEMIAKHDDLKADVLKVGHHGSNKSSSKEFLDLVKPSISVISDGKGNDYGFPNKNVLARLKTVKSKVLRTDLSGTIVIESNGKKVMIK